MIIRVFLVLSIIGALYVTYVSKIFSKGLEQQILAAITTDAYPYIPRSVALIYLEYGPEIEKRKWQTPSIPFAVAGCDLSSSFVSCEEIKNVLSILHSQGAEIDAYHAGMTALHAAILSKQEVMVLYLLELGADPKAKIRSESKKFEGMSALQFSEHLAAGGKEKELEIFEILRNVQ